jgi:hypothetical protein
MFSIYTLDFFFINLDLVFGFLGSVARCGGGVGWFGLNFRYFFLIDLVFRFPGSPFELFSFYSF